MPIGIVSDEEFYKELERLSPAERRKEAVVVETPTKGRKEGDVNIPDSLRRIISEEQLMNGRKAAVALAKDFGISPSSVSAYANGATSTKSYNEPKESLVNHLNKTKERAVKRANKTLNAALGAITQDKLDYSDAKDLSGIAKDMSVIIKNLEPATSVDADTRAQAPQFIIYAPQFKKEETFEVINVTE